MIQTNIRRNYKDSLFRILFKEKQALLSLYNAVNGSDYQNPEDLQINTLEDVLYIGMKNDVSFLIDHYMNLYEHQSSWNPNMPLRDFWYMSDLYKGYVEQNKLNIYSNTQLRLPAPKCIVFYNGTKKIADRTTVRLSELFDIPEGQESDLECVVTYLNVNYGHNQELMAQCQKLKEYSILIHQIRLQLAQGKQLKAAVDHAVEYCIQNHVLESFLRKHRAEVGNMNWWDFDEELHLKTEKENSYQEGVKAERANTEKARMEAEQLRQELDQLRTRLNTMNWWNFDEELHLKTEKENSYQEGINAERANTEKEKERADSAEAELEKLRRELAQLKQGIEN